MTCSSSKTFPAPKLGVTLSALAVVLLALGSSVPAMAADDYKDPPPATAKVFGEFFDVEAFVDYENAILLVSGPGDYALSREFHGNNHPISVNLLLDASAPIEGNGSRSSVKDRRILPDGRYHYEVLFYQSDSEIQRATGAFQVVGGTATDDLPFEAQKNQAEPGSGNGTHAVGAKGIFPDDFVSISDLAGDNEVGVNYFITSGNSMSIRNQSGILKMLDDTGGSGTALLSALDTNGRIGIGTVAPQTPVQIAAGVTPQLRLSGFSLLGSGKADLFVGPGGLWFVDNNDDNIVKFNHSAPADALVIGGSGVGMGIGSPSSSLHVARSDGTAKLFVQETSGTSAARELFKLSNNGGPFFIFENTDIAQSFSFAMGATGHFLLSHQQTSGVQMRLTPSGDMTITGSLSEGSSRTIKDDITPLDGETVLAKLESLPVSEWSYTADRTKRHVGPMAEDFHAAFGLGPDNKHITPRDLAGVALAAAKALKAENDVLKAKVAEIDAIKARLEELETRDSR